MIKETLESRGKVTLTLTKPNGVETSVEKNLIVNTGLNYIASRMKDATAGVMSHIALGSSTTAASPTDTDLGSLISSRIALTSTTVTDNEIVYVGTFGPGVSTGAITEAGIFNASTSGTMLSHVVFPVINKQANDSLAITWTITHTAS